MHLPTSPSGNRYDPIWGSEGDSWDEQAGSSWQIAAQNNGIGVQATNHSSYQGKLKKTQINSRQQEVQSAWSVRPTSPTRRGPLVPQLPVQSMKVKMIALPVERSQPPQPPQPPPPPAAPESPPRVTWNTQQWWHTADSSGHAGVSTRTSQLHQDQASFRPKPCLKTDKPQAAISGARPPSNWDCAEQLKAALAPVRVPGPSREHADPSSPTAPTAQPPSFRRGKPCVSPVLDRWTDDESAQPSNRFDRPRPSGSISKREVRDRFRRHSTTAALARSIMLDSQLIGEEATSEMSSPMHPQAGQAAKAPRFATTPEGLNLIATQFHGQPLTSQQRVSNRRESWKSRQAIQNRALEFVAIQEAQLQAQAAAEQKRSLLDTITDEWPPERGPSQQPPQQPPALPSSSKGMAGPTDVLDALVNSSRQQQDMHKLHASASLPGASNPGDLDGQADLKGGPPPKARARSGQPAALPTGEALRRLLETPIALMTPPRAEPTQFLAEEHPQFQAEEQLQAGRSSGPQFATEQPVTSEWGQPPAPRTAAPLLGPIFLQTCSADEAMAKEWQEAEFAGSVDASKAGARQQHRAEVPIASSSWEQPYVQPEGRPLSPKVIAKIDFLIAEGVLQPGDIDKKAMKHLAAMPASLGIEALDKLYLCDLRYVHNIAAYLQGIIRNNYSSKGRSETEMAYGTPFELDNLPSSSGNRAAAVAELWLNGTAGGQRTPREVKGREMKGMVADSWPDTFSFHRSEDTREGMGNGNTRAPLWMQGGQPHFADDRYGKGPNAWKDPLETLPGASSSRRSSGDLAGYMVSRSALRAVATKKASQRKGQAESKCAKQAAARMKASGFDKPVSLTAQDHDPKQFEEDAGQM